MRAVWGKAYGRCQDVLDSFQFFTGRADRPSPFDVVRLYEQKWTTKSLKQTKKNTRGLWLNMFWFDASGKRHQNKTYTASSRLVTGASSRSL